MESEGAHIMGAERVKPSGRYTWTAQQQSVPTKTVNDVLIDTLGWLEGKKTFRNIDTIDKDLKDPDRKELAIGSLKGIRKALLNFITRGCIDELSVLLTNPHALNIVRSGYILGEPFPALIYAVQRGMVKCVDFLYKKGACTKIIDSLDNVVMTAVVHERIPCLGYLLKNKLFLSFIDVLNAHGYTPLMEAVKQDSPKMVQLLLDAGAKPEIRSRKESFNAEDFARDKRFEACLKLLRDKRKEKRRILDRFGLDESPVQRLAVSIPRRSMTPSFRLTPTANMSFERNIIAVQ